jgi:hypothetical protein
LYLYHASAHGLGGEITYPVNKLLVAQAAASLSSVGGQSTANTGNFKLDDIVSFASANVQVIGGRVKTEPDETYSTTTTVTITKLSIRGIVTADKVVLKLGSRHRLKDGPEPSFTIDEDSGFENLAISGQPVAMDFAHDTFNTHNTFAKFQQAFASSSGAAATGPRKEILDCMMGCQLQTNGSSLQHLTDVMNGFNKVKDTNTLSTPLLCSLVKKINPVNVAGVKIQGPIISVPGFGTVYLGEVMVMPGMRRVNMLRLELGSPVVGRITASAGESNGSIFPP